MHNFVSIHFPPGAFAAPVRPAFPSRIAGAGRPRLIRLRGLLDSNPGAIGFGQERSPSCSREGIVAFKFIPSVTP